MTIKTSIAAMTMAAIVLSAASWPTQAQELDSDTMGVSLEVEAFCSVVTSALVFTPVSTLTITTAVNDQTAGNIEVTCTPDTPYTIGLSAGLNESTPDDVTTRQLQNDGIGVAHATLDYNLFSNSGRTTVWGNTAGTNTVDDVGDGTAQDHSVYGIIAGSQAVSLGAYTDTVVATVWYDEPI